MSSFIRWFIGATLLAILFFDSAPLKAAGTLFIIGGRLRPNNAAIYQRMIDAGGGAKSCRVAVFRTASHSLASAERFRDVLQTYGVSPLQVTLLDIHPDNAATTAHHPKTVELLGKCTLAYFVGGDQQRITRSLLASDGRDTPVLAAVRTLLDRGGVVAGSSAGAAMQSRVMISASGLPHHFLDEGMDPLDFGIAGIPERRGLIVLAGLGFFTEGIIDQHFGQFRGRLGRLSRALSHTKVGYGFGVDENTALVATPGAIDKSRPVTWEVIGEGNVTVVDARRGTSTDGPLGCRIGGLSISCLQAGDRWDPVAGEVRVAAEKKPVAATAADRNRGNFLITDIAGRGAASHALLAGLGDNTSRMQHGITLRYTSTFGHGYRYTFRKTDRSKCWTGVVANWDSVTVQDIELAIEPIVSSLLSPNTELPADLPVGTPGIACQAVWFRGMLVADASRKLHPAAPITRSELAIALAHSLRLFPPLEEPTIADVPSDAWWRDELGRVLEAKLMTLDAQGRFRPEEPISRQVAAAALQELYRRNGGRDRKDSLERPADENDVDPQYRDPLYATYANGILQTTNGRIRPRDLLTRAEAAVAICHCLGLEW